MAQGQGPRDECGNRGTCYAFAAATAIRSTEMRIFNREVEPHDELVKLITTKCSQPNGYVFAARLTDLRSRKGSFSLLMGVKPLGMQSLFAVLIH